MDEKSTIKSIVFAGTVPANSNLTLVSPLITDTFEVLEISAKFALNTNSTVKLRYFVAPDTSNPTNGKPGGFNILEEYGQVDYLTGDDETKYLRCSASAPQRNNFVKVYVENTDAFPHTIDSIITIEIT